MRKLYAFLPAFAVVAAVFPAAPSHAASTLIVVQNPATCLGQAFTGIQAAVDAAVSGDTVQVCPGLYAEIVNVTTPDVTLVGSTTLPADCDVVVPADPATDSIIQTTNPTGTGIMNLSADNVVSRGFTVQGNMGGGPGIGDAGVYTSLNHAGYLITNNVIQNNPIGINLATVQTTVQSEVSHNCIRQNNISPDAPSNGTGIYSDQGLHSMLIDNNGILITKSGSLTVSDINITNNVSHEDGAFVGIFHSTSSEITNNQTVDDVRQGIAVANDNSGLLVQGNNIQGGGRGILTTAAGEPASLTIAKSHEGDFKAGKQGTYTITVGNAGPGPTDGTPVTVTDVLPQGLTAVSMTDDGWTCDVATLTCTRSDALAAGASYPPITLVVDVPCECKKKRGGGGCEPRKGVDTVTVTGGRDSATHTATDPTTIKGSENCKKPKDNKKHHHHQHHRPDHR